MTVFFRLFEFKKAIFRFLKGAPDLKNPENSDFSTEVTKILIFSCKLKMSMLKKAENHSFKRKLAIFNDF